MNDLILSSFISLFALLAKERHLDDAMSRKMLVNCLHQYFGLRNTDLYTDLYTDIRAAYEMAPNLNALEVAREITSKLSTKINLQVKALLLLRLMESCNGGLPELFNTITDEFHIGKNYFRNYQDFVDGKTSDCVMVLHPDGFKGELKTLLDPLSRDLIVTYTGDDVVLLDDVPVLSGVYQIWRQSSVLKSRYSGKTLYYSTILDQYDRDADHTRQKVTFSGRDINFRFPNSENGMHDLSFDLSGGELLAIMGGSGTGKTTLLSLLNGTMKPQSGSITINGHDISEPKAKELIGYVPQDDLLIEQLTVYDNLWFTAKLCFAGMENAELDSRVMKTLKDLGLDAVKDLKVGSAINKFISGGQRKRLNIALELIREPAVLFLDEPTSGLSSADTEKVINLLKEQTFKGKLIVVNIHQPSSDVYKLFDRLWLLDRGGYPVFDGNPIEAITYFKDAARYADAETSACPTCGNVNPEIILNILDEKKIDDTGEPTEERRMKPEEWHQLYLERREKLDEDHVLKNAAPVTGIPPSDQRKPNKFRQFAIFLQRNLKSMITNRQYLCITLLEAPLLAIGCSWLTRYAPPEGYTVLTNKNMVSYLFMAVIVATFIGMSGSAEEIIKDRALLKRERFLHLSYGSYIWSKIAGMTFLSFIQTFLFIFVGNSIMGLQAMSAMWWPILFVTAVVANLTGLLLSQCLKSVVAIYISIPLLLIPQILLCGLVVSFSDLTPRSTTGNVPLIGNIIPSRWAFEALAVTTYADNPYEAPLFETEKKKYEDFYYNQGFLYELQSQLSTLKYEQKKKKEVNPEHINVVRTNLPQLTAYCGMTPYQGDYSIESLTNYLKEAETILNRRCNKSTLRANDIVSKRIREMGKAAVLELKRNNHNENLEDCVIGANQKSMLSVVDGHIVPRTGIIFLTPQSHAGNAPFYSSEKIVGSWHIATIRFNIAVLLFMALLLTILLLTDYPGRLLRKDQ